MEMFSASRVPHDALKVKVVEENGNPYRASLNSRHRAKRQKQRHDTPPSKRAQTFVRFGKRAQTFVRFGKRAQTFVRFGRSNPEQM
ncbi:hypothetical protein TELCIR_15652 [Teladorsagia circumcincta]|uniref:Uncharacterized protein n=1 Tax=Teladorsagia circumcincta TaxID=45464 RepID=A0A2G9TXS4_TELCI|nr:hypothetical protein TELCIR_15652 [Teladorsagia circumcincta]